MEPDDGAWREKDYIIDTGRFQYPINKNVSKYLLLFVMLIQQIVCAYDINYFKLCLMIIVVLFFSWATYIMPWSIGAKLAETIDFDNIIELLWYTVYFIL